ncbi:MAG: cyanophycin synthetase, partial [Arcobacteraceae bacterium]|nr:cyanophycin synthetase [Arcobacteraceae bacterium]
DVVKNDGDLIIIDDYAHHPTEIKVTMQSIELYKNLTSATKNIVVWQPHKYSRTRDNLEAFKTCFAGCDELIILPVWTVNEPILDIDFVHEFASYNPIFADSVKRYGDVLEIWKDEHIITTIKEGIVLGVGAGDITYQLRA